ncbi:SDR family NAD(P)-dependent oxidoreductase [Natronosalvus rutilus]|uniref:SDR family oxidoreductase n=1 Tax=Natronosalvus rutilus TaxID=2953753 RepID=A0A9E7SSF5_9EURY|nr:SDR family NAD(P)-dependent oxidoreductase [Natronosalvus rutilus]UTF52464.1 SDR family oxidoreductase [Natronosalvus rutilus]
MSGLFADETVIVTGGTRGIGRAIVDRFAAEGANLVVSSRSEDDVTTVADELSAEYGVDAVGVPCDVTNADEIEVLVDATLERFGEIDALVSNAGGSINDDNLHRIDEDAWDRTVELNLKSLFLVAREVLPPMVESGGGSIVHMSSVNGLDGIGQIAYSSARSGVLGLSRLIATQYGRHGVRSNIVCPGTIETDRRSGQMDETGESRASDEHDGEWTQRDQWIDQYPTGRFGRPEEVADATLFLASDMSSFVNGTHLVVDGGLTAGLDWSFQQQIFGSEETPTRPSKR